MILLAALVGIGAGAGGWLVASGLRPTASPRRPSGTVAERLSGWVARVDGRRVGMATLGALAGLVLTRWPAVVVGGAAAGWFAARPGRRTALRREGERVEAIAQWCEMLRDAAGTARGLEGILASTAASAPEAIGPAVRHMAVLLESEPLDTALDALADELAHPTGDLVVTALRVAAGAGSRRTRQVLDNLAAAAHHEAGMRRRVEVARARPRSTMRLVAVIVAVFVAGLVVLARDYMAPFSSPLGQLVLVAITAYWGLGFWWMSRLGRLPELERFLVSRGSPVAARPGAGRP